MRIDGKSLDYKDRLTIFIIGFTIGALLALIMRVVGVRFCLGKQALEH